MSRHDLHCDLGRRLLFTCANAPRSRELRRILAPALLWLASLWAVSAPALAQAPVVEPNVDAVVQAGRWSEVEAGEGSYRVVVVGQGFEHVSTRVLAQWKADGGEDGQARIVHEAELVAPGNYSLTAPKLTTTASGVRVELRGVATYDSRRRVVCRFDLAPGGKVTVVRACGL
ncbi:hypothetical protein LEN_2304 [Lysobacter enzymogenes]|uniref:Uncharacterized protein n=1 Tax=Lysobacter enzymogenes TaxID=69 RepID=A0AAU9AGF7_LYSEN|nr:hypothetical protein LEN_2304 [Lysobacter enzymogenes]